MTYYNAPNSRKRFSNTNPPNFFQRDSLLLGIIAGLIAPFVGLAVLILLNEQLATANIRTAQGTFDGLTDKLIRLMAICLNLIPFTIFQRRRFDRSMQGVFIPTMFYIIIWIYIYRSSLFG